MRANTVHFAVASMRTNITRDEHEQIDEENTVKARKSVSDRKYVPFEFATSRLCPLLNAPATVFCDLFTHSSETKSQTTWENASSFGQANIVLTKRIYEAHSRVWVANDDFHIFQNVEFRCYLASQRHWSNGSNKKGRHSRLRDGIDCTFRFGRSIVRNT